MDSEQFQVFVSKSDHDEMIGWKNKYLQTEEKLRLFLKQSSDSTRNKEKQILIQEEQVKYLNQIFQTYANIFKKDKNISEMIQQSQLSESYYNELASQSQILLKQQQKIMLKEQFIKKYQKYTSIMKQISQKIQSQDYLIQNYQKELNQKIQVNKFRKLQNINNDLECCIIQLSQKLKFRQNQGQQLETELKLFQKQLKQLRLRYQNTQDQLRKTIVQRDNQSIQIDTLRIQLKNTNQNAKQSLTQQENILKELLSLRREVQQERKRCSELIQKQSMNHNQQKSLQLSLKNFQKQNKNCKLRIQSLERNLDKMNTELKDKKQICEKLSGQILQKKQIISKENSKENDKNAKSMMIKLMIEDYVGQVQNKLLQLSLTQNEMQGVVFGELDQLILHINKMKEKAKH